MVVTPRLWHFPRPICITGLDGYTGVRLYGQTASPQSDPELLWQYESRMQGGSVEIRNSKFEIRNIVEVGGWKFEIRLRTSP